MNWLPLLIFFTLPSFAQEFKVLTWNTFLIPPPYNFTKQKQRTAEMMRILPTMDHDLMFFQETFFDKKRSHIMQALQATHPFIALPMKGRKLKQVQDSGLFIASRYPVKILDQVIFRDCAKADCFSSKSAILVEVSLPQDRKVQMINTHLQAWDGPKVVAIRKLQLSQIKEMMARHVSQGVPQILVGDLNIDGRVIPEYTEALQFLEMTSEPLTGDLLSSNGFSTEGCFKNPGSEREEWIDHMWLKANGTPTRIESKRVLPITGLIKHTECPLSDHYAVEAFVKL